MRNRFYTDLPTTSNSSSSHEKNESSLGGHFKWRSIKQFVYIAHAFSNSSVTFDIFSKVMVVNAHLFEYIIYALLIGVSYMFMDYFIKQYTRRLDTSKMMNPLLRGVSFGILLQTAVWTLLHASSLADSVRYFMVSMARLPSWTKCTKNSTNGTCLSAQELIMQCQNKGNIDFSSTSAHISYTKQFSSYDRNSLSMRLFVTAIVWICNFFVAAIHDIALIRLFRFSFLFGIFSTGFILTFLIFSSPYIAKAFDEMMNIQNGFNHNSFNLITDPFGVGLIGVYDFGIISPYIMVDNAVIIFTVVFIASAFARSLIVRVLYMKLTSCVHVKFVETPHHLMFAVLPLSTEFMSAHKLFVLYIYMYMMVALTACLAMFTSTTSKLLHSEFRSVKNIYFTGLLCFLGFALSLPLSIITANRRVGLLYGLNICTLYLGGFKVAIVMYVYGVQRFATDIQFWLGFKPTRFWMFLWVMLPVFIFVILIKKVANMMCFEDSKQQTVAFAWILITAIIVLLLQGKIIANYILKNNLVGVFKSHPKYGPPEFDDRKRRRNFNDLCQSRQCVHTCLILDETHQCNHMPLIFMNASEHDSDSSLTNIYNAGPSKKRMSSVMDPSNIN